MITKQREMDPLESREIRGLSYKALAWLISSTITIVVFVVTSYFLLKTNIENVDGKIETVRNEKASDSRYNDLRLQIIESNVKQLEIKIENLRNQTGMSSQLQELKPGGGR